MRSLRALAVIILGAMIIPTVVTAQPSHDAYFDQVWARADGPVGTGQVSRTWVWGPTKYGASLMEDYAESPDGKRLVQYFDKARMEITHPGSNPNSSWYVTNGLLVVELITGQLQVGDDQFEDRLPAEIGVAGDPGDEQGPTYATFAGLLDVEPAIPGALITQRLTRDGTVTRDLAIAHLITVAEIDTVTNHSIAQPFREFMDATGIIWDGSSYVTGRLFAEPLGALGRPITEPYWASIQVAGTVQDVLLQCFERRCLTYTPGNTAGWQVEAGNVGRHYYEWRYLSGAPTDPDPVDPDPAIPLDPIVEKYPPGSGSGPGGMYNCADFDTQQDAQDFFEYHGGSPANNVDFLDFDGDGIACEELSPPPPPSPSGPTPPRGPSGEDGRYNCADFDFQEQAQEFFDSMDGDPHGLDNDNDGIACEDRPKRGSGGSGGGGPVPPARADPKVN